MGICEVSQAKCFQRMRIVFDSKFNCSTCFEESGKL